MRDRKKKRVRYSTCAKVRYKERKRKKERNEKESDI
jgi:hypothetical protein